MNDIADGFDGSMVGNDIPRGTKYDTGADDGTTDDVGILPVSYTHLTQPTKDGV